VFLLTLDYYYYYYYYILGVILYTVPSRTIRDMKAYPITTYTRKMARKLGVVVKPSSNSDKKIDVYRKSRKIASVGARGMNDFPTYIRTRGLAYAKTRRRLYKMRHEKDRHIKWSRGWLADKLLW
jgi:hypothetical protein